MKISPKYNSSHWNELHLIPTSTNDNWKKAVAIFDNRYSYRFIRQIDTLRHNTVSQAAIYSGFAIMSINCLLIETLNQFYYGVKDTDELKKDKTIKHIENIKDTFVDFLTTSTNFNGAFDKQSSELFYYHIRCGLLHQAETKMSSTIHIDKKQKNLVEKIYDDKTVTGISIRRDLFTDCLFAEYSDYKKRILATPADNELRRRFITKMDLICDDKK